MPTTIARETYRIQTRLAEPEFPTAATAGRQAPRYPYPFLRLGEDLHEAEFEGIVLENECLRLAVFPELGGQILALLDKRRNLPIFEIPEVLPVREDGEGGIEIAHGIQFLCGNPNRPGRTGPLSYAVREAEDESDPAGLVLFELIAGQGISWHGTVALAPGASSFAMSMGALNRSLQEAPFQSGIRVFLPDAGETGVPGVWYSPSRLAGVYLWTEPGILAPELANSDLLRMPKGAKLAPRQTDEWLCHIRPIGGIPSVRACSADAAIGWDETRFGIETADFQAGADIFVEVDGETRTVAAALYAETPFLAEQAQLGGEPSRALVRSAKGEVLAETGKWTAPPSFGAPGAEDPALAKAIARFDAGEDPTALAHEASKRHASKFASELVLAGWRMRQQDWQGAIPHLERALAYGAEDPIAWWQLAACRRLAGETPIEEPPELANAHFLAPLDPLLRAEAFLGQTDQGTEANPLLNAFGDAPDGMAEVACQLIDLGMREDAYRWLNACLRHRDVPIVRYLFADLLARHAGMDAEAALHLEAAERAALEPPFPWRMLEWAAIGRLAERFPAAKRLQSLAALGRALQAI